MKLESFKIESELEADAYLHDLLTTLEYRSMGEIQRRADAYIPNTKLKRYFITKASVMLNVA